MKEKLILYILEGQVENVTLYFDDPKQEPNYPDLAEYIETQGYNPRDEDSLWQYAIDNEVCDEKVRDEAKTTGKHPTEFIGDLTVSIQELGPSWWEHDQWDTELSPMAQTFHRLSDLGASLHVEGLSFYEGDRPGSNLTYVTAKNQAVVDQLIEFLGKKSYETTIRKFSW